MRRMGVPVVLPSKYPERIFILSASFRGVVILLWPGRRLSSATCISSSVIRIPGGQPSTTTPTAPPWDSPKVVILNNCPKLFPAIFEYYTLGAFLRCGAPASRSPYAIYGSVSPPPSPPPPLLLFSPPPPPPPPPHTSTQIFFFSPLYSPPPFSRCLGWGGGGGKAAH